MEFNSQSEAKQFFAQRVITQAEKEGVGLSEAERYMLSWSEVDPEFKPNYDLAAKIDKEIPQDKYEAKIRGLIERAYRHDVQTDPLAETRYREAYNTLKQGGHYILIMVKPALRSKWQRWLMSFLGVG
jgi:hypothetical protein